MSVAPFFSEQRALPGGGLALVLYGELDYDTAPFARQAVEAALAAADGPLVLDVGSVVVADAFGIAVLVKSHHTHGATLANVSPAVADVLRRTRFPTRFLRPGKQDVAAA
jgi:anti-anti-sigma factor